MDNLGSILFLDYNYQFFFYVLVAAFANNHLCKFATKNAVFLNVVVYFNIFLLSFLL